MKARKSARPWPYLYGIYTSWKQSSIDLFTRFFYPCITSIWRRADVVAISNPNKPLDEARSYRPISLLCVPSKILEWLNYSRVEPIIDSLLSPKQVSFRRGRSTVEQATRMSQDVEDCFESKKKADTLFIELAAANDTVWHRNLVCKLCSDYCLAGTWSKWYILSTITVIPSPPVGEEKEDYDVPHGSVLIPLLFNAYIHDLPPITSRLYVNDLPIVHPDVEWISLEKILNRDMAAVSSYLRKWRLKLSKTKTVSTAFDLDNKKAKRDLNIMVEENGFLYNLTLPWGYRG